MVWGLLGKCWKQKRADDAIVKAQAKEPGIGYQNLIQALVHNYAKGKIKLGF